MHPPLEIEPMLPIDCTTSTNRHKTPSVGSLGATSTLWGFKVDSVLAQMYDTTIHEGSTSTGSAKKHCRRSVVELPQSTAGVNCIIRMFVEFGYACVDRGKCKMPP